MTVKSGGGIGATRLMMHGVRRIPIKGDFIRLDALLKFASIASTGGEAKIIIQNGEVRVGKNICTERGKKIRHGDIVRIGAETLVVKCKNVPTAEGQKKSDDR